MLRLSQFLEDDQIFSSELDFTGIETMDAKKGLSLMALYLFLLPFSHPRFQSRISPPCNDIDHVIKGQTFFLMEYMAADKTAYTATVEQLLLSIHEHHRENVRRAFLPHPFTDRSGEPPKEIVDLCEHLIDRYKSMPDLSSSIVDNAKPVHDTSH